MKSLVLFLALLLAGSLSLQAGYAPYTERGTVDFDVLYKDLQPYGQWSPHPDYRYVYTPKIASHSSWHPYREGRWIYSDNGWTWKGSESWNWATDHYGFWTKRGLNSWAWVPGDQWLPSSVEWLQSGDYVGWRACELDRYSNMMESDEERYQDPSEWNFILKSKITQVLQSGDFVSDAQTAELLKKREPADHVFQAYREIPRPGPAPQVADATTKVKIEVPALMNIRNIEEPLPEDSKLQVFVFRPKFYQDIDGVYKRIESLLKGNDGLQAEKAAVAATFAPKAPTAAEAEAQAKAEASQRKEIRRLQAEQKHMDKLYK